jgi:hypothetical protein
VNAAGGFPGRHVAFGDKAGELYDKAFDTGPYQAKRAAHRLLKASDEYGVQNRQT